MKGCLIVIWWTSLGLWRFARGPRLTRGKTLLGFYLHQQASVFWKTLSSEDASILFSVPPACLRKAHSRLVFRVLPCQEGFQNVWNWRVLGLLVLPCQEGFQIVWNWRILGLLTFWPAAHVSWKHELYWASFCIIFSLAGLYQEFVPAPESGSGRLLGFYGCLNVCLVADKALLG